MVDLSREVSQPSPVLLELPDVDRVLPAHRGQRRLQSRDLDIVVLGFGFIVILSKEILIFKRNKAY